VVPVFTSAGRECMRHAHVTCTKGGGEPRCKGRGGEPLHIPIAHHPPFRSSLAVRWSTPGLDFGISKIPVAPIGPVVAAAGSRTWKGLGLATSGLISFPPGQAVSWGLGGRRGNRAAAHGPIARAAYKYTAALVIQAPPPPPPRARKPGCPPGPIAQGLAAGPDCLKLRVQCIICSD
jgi:hypothetical protein